MALVAIALCPLAAQLDACTSFTSRVNLHPNQPDGKWCYQVKSARECDNSYFSCPDACDIERCPLCTHRVLNAYIDL